MFANPVFITPGRLTAFLILKSFLIFLISLLNTVIEKKLKLAKQNVKTDEWLGNLCRAVKSKHLPGFPRTFCRRFLKTKVPKKH